MVKLHFFLMAMLATFNVIAADIEVKVQTPIETDEAFKVQFIARSAVDAPPDFSPLAEKFDLINKQQSSNQFSFNGHLTQQFIWTVTLATSTPGVQTIPAIAFGADTSPETTINVAQLQAKKKDDGLMIDANLDVDTAYVQQQMVLSVDLYFTGGFSKTSISEPSFSHDKIKIIPIQEYKNQGNKTIDGVDYQHFQAKFAIFPLKSGELTIKPIRFVGMKLTGKRSPSIFFRQQTVKKRVHTDRIQLTIQPKPDSFAGPWLPAQQLQMVETWSDDPPKFTVGESITRTLNVMASGITGEQLPEVDLGKAATFKQYPDQAATDNQLSDTSIIGIRTEKIAYVPTKAGTFTLPEIKLNWWDTINNKVRTSIVPSRKIDVQPSPVSATTKQIPTVTPKLSDNTQNETHIVRETKTSSDIAWPWLIAILILWGLTILGWFWHVNAIRSGHTKKPEPEPKRDNVKQVKLACKGNDPKKVYQSVMLWGRQQYGQAFTLSQLKKTLNPDAAKIFTELESASYANKDVTWSNCDQLVNQLKQIETRSPAENSGLTPLYPA